MADAGKGRESRESEDLSFRRVTSAAARDGDPDARAFCDSRIHIVRFEGRVGEALVFLVGGSRGSTYRVTFDPRYAARCECPSPERPCKHVLFVRRFVLKQDVPARQGALEDVRTVIESFDRSCLEFTCSLCQEDRNIDGDVILKWCPRCAQPICWSCYQELNATGLARCPVCRDLSRYVELAGERDLPSGVARWSDLRPSVPDHEDDGDGGNWNPAPMEEDEEEEAQVRRTKRKANRLPDIEDDDVPKRHHSSASSIVGEGTGGEVLAGHEARPQAIVHAAASGSRMPSSPPSAGSTGDEAPGSSWYMGLFGMVRSETPHLPLSCADLGVPAVLTELLRELDTVVPRYRLTHAHLMCEHSAADLPPDRRFVWLVGEVPSASEVVVANIHGAPDGLTRRLHVCFRHAGTFLPPLPLHGDLPVGDRPCWFGEQSAAFDAESSALLRSSPLSSAVYAAFRCRGGEVTDELAARVVTRYKGFRLLCVPRADGRGPLSLEPVPAFPATVDGMPVDVEEGSVEAAADFGDDRGRRRRRPLRVGCSIGVFPHIPGARTGAGTLGGLLRDEENNTYALTCAHVVEVEGRTVVQPSRPDDRGEGNEIARVTACAMTDRVDAAACLLLPGIEFQLEWCGGELPDNPEVEPPPGPRQAGPRPVTPADVRRGFFFFGRTSGYQRIDFFYDRGTAKLEECWKGFTYNLNEVAKTTHTIKGVWMSDNPCGARGDSGSCVCSVDDNGRAHPVAQVVARFSKTGLLICTPISVVLEHLSARLSDVERRRVHLAFVE